MQKWKKQLLPLFCLTGVFFCPVTAQATSDTTLDLNTIDANVANNIEEKKNLITNTFITEFQNLQTSTQFYFEKHPNFGIVKDTDFVYIYDSPNGTKIGKLYTNGQFSYSTTQDGWYQIQSGDISGWIPAEHIFVDKDAVPYAETLTKEKISVSEDTQSYFDSYQVLKGDIIPSGTSLEKINWLYNPQTQEYLLETIYQEKTIYLPASSLSCSYNLTTAEHYTEPKPGEQLTNYALSFVGNPYVWGGTNPYSGADCSGFVQYVYAQYGVSLPRTTDAQLAWCASHAQAVSPSNIQAGDLVFYSGHVAILTGNGSQIVHASNSAPYPQGGIKTTDNYAYTTVLGIYRIF